MSAYLWSRRRSPVRATGSEKKRTDRASERENNVLECTKWAPSFKGNSHSKEGPGQQELKRALQRRKTPDCNEQA